MENIKLSLMVIVRSAMQVLFLYFGFGLIYFTYVFPLLCEVEYSSRKLVLLL